LKNLEGCRKRIGFVSNFTIASDKMAMLDGGFGIEECPGCPSTIKSKVTYPFSDVAIKATGLSMKGKIPLTIGVPSSIKNSTFTPLCCNVVEIR